MPLTPARRQAGITLIESLIALVVAALGILGVLGMQMRTLADTQTGVRRAQAIRLIEDLSERTRANPNSLAVLAEYNIYWDGNGSWKDGISKDCSRAECGPEDMSVYNIRQWVTSVRQTLPGSTLLLLGQHEENASWNGSYGPPQALGNQRQLVIGIGWRENEKSSDVDYDRPITGKNDSGAYANGCPAGKTCHFQHISLSGRCAPYLGDVSVRFFCPGQ